MSEHETVTLPEPVLARVLSLASTALGSLEADDVPAALRRIARFTPAKRARLGAQAIAAALEADTAFRERVAAAVADPGGQPPPPAGLNGAEAPVLAAAQAYLNRPSGWRDVVATAGQVLSERVADAHTQELAAAAGRLERELERVRTNAKQRADSADADLAAARLELAELRKRVRILTGDARRSERERIAALAETSGERERAAAAAAEAAATERRLRGQIADLQQQAATTRRSNRSDRDSDATRLRLLLDTIAASAQGLREELALPQGERLPGDVVAEARMPDPTGGAGIDDVAMLERVLGLPRAHLVVDGYNVTKTGYDALPLAAQRDRLLTGLGALAARTGVEITCVFDGAAAPPVAPAAPRGVRLIFSAPGELADDVIKALVAAEPAGRAGVVVSSDREVAEAARRAGWYAAPARLLLDRLGRHVRGGRG